MSNAADRDKGRRLLDLLAGWTEYLDSCANHEDPGNGVAQEIYATEEDAVSDLYQEAGRLVDSGAKGDDITHFIVSRVVPLVLDGPEAPCKSR